MPVESRFDGSYFVTIQNHEEGPATLRIYLVTEGLMNLQRKFMGEHLVDPNGDCTIRGYDSKRVTDVVRKGDLLDPSTVALTVNNDNIMLRVVDYSLGDGMTLGDFEVHLRSNLKIVQETFQHAMPSPERTLHDPLRNVPADFQIHDVFMSMITTLENIPVNPGNDFME